MTRRVWGSRVEYRVPAPAAWTDVVRAIRSAEQDLHAAGLLARNVQPAADQILVSADAGVVVVSIEARP